MMWKELGIEETKDLELIRQAYHEKLPLVNPEEDAQGFMRLRKAFEDACDYATRPAEDEEAEQETLSNPNEVDLWVKKAEKIYASLESRRDLSCWERLLKDPVCEGLDTEIEAGEKLLVFISYHSYLPTDVWRLLNKHFDYSGNAKTLKEKFPPNFIDYIIWQTDHQDFIDYEMFEGDLSGNPDEYIAKLYETKRMLSGEEEQRKSVEKNMEALRAYDVTHPFTDVVEVEYWLSQNVNQKKALEVMEELDFAYSENAYIEHIYAKALLANNKIEKAKAVYDALLEADDKNVSAAIGQANCIYLLGNVKDAKEMVEDILEKEIQNQECQELMEKISEDLVREYEAAYKENPTTEIGIELGWCYYQQHEYEKAEKFMESVPEEDTYEFVNIRCRIYLCNEHYHEAYPWLLRWMDFLDQTVDDGSKKMRRRMDRKAYALFSKGIANWHLIQTKDPLAEENHLQKDQAYSFIQDAARMESSEFMQFQYAGELARLYNEDKVPDLAIEVCDALLEKDPGYFPGYVFRQQAYYDKKDARGIIDDFYHCHEIAPYFPDPYLRAAEVFFDFERYDDLEQIFSMAKEAGIESDTLRFYQLKELHYKEFAAEKIPGVLKQYEPFFNEILKKKAENKETDMDKMDDLFFEYAILLWDGDNQKGALNILKDYSEKNGFSLKIEKLKYDILYKSDGFDKALEVAIPLVSQDPDVDGAEIRIASCYEKMDKRAQALQILKKIEARNKNSLPALRKLFEFYRSEYERNEKEEDAKTAVAYLDTLLSLEEHVYYYERRCVLNYELYELERAREDCESGLKLDPEDFFLYYRLGFTMSKMGQKEQAVEPLLKAIELNPGYRWPYIELGGIYRFLGKYGKSDEYFKKVLDMEPEEFRRQYLEETAQNQMLRGEYTKAIVAYLECLRRPECQKGAKWERYYRSKYLQKLADGYREKGDWKNAAAQYLEIIEMCKKDAWLVDELEDALDFFRDWGKLSGSIRIVKQIIKRAERYEKKRGGKDEYLISCYRALAGYLYEQKKYGPARKYAVLALKRIEESSGSLSNYLNGSKKYHMSNYYRIIRLEICRGNLAEAEQLLARMHQGYQCTMCEKSDCFEYFLLCGMIAEEKGDLEKAKAEYRHALAIKPDYYDAAYFLQRLENRKKK